MRLYVFLYSPSIVWQIQSDCATPLASGPLALGTESGNSGLRSLCELSHGLSCARRSAPSCKHACARAAAHINEEFLSGCIHLRGQARSLDLALLTREVEHTDAISH